MTLMLLDSASLWYRAYFGMPDTLVSPSGMPVNAIRGFLDMTSQKNVVETEEIHSGS